ncbi:MULTISPECIES: acetate kinase [Clostridium]|jgi:acetate kinase|uniref:Acetate kinase n=2 Tax=root TaxID=1 RepID=R9CEU9_9CLOT|nr:MULTISPECIES: acetate kinase [Clostridium]EOR27854.1 acetate kinase A/propionate kinase 2 [Clostridium sartagoforme AAU1]KLE14875.1 acetate kinase [Clostridium sp. C8]
MKILVINCGSSSLKYQLIEMNTEEVMCQGLVERIGLADSVLTHKNPIGKKYVVNGKFTNHKEAINIVLETLLDKKYGVIQDINEIYAVGHRVVHGGEKYSNSVLIDDEVLCHLEECIKLAPIHNPPNITGIKACKELMPNTPMIAVFDTAFHQTMPQEAYIYPIEYSLYEKYGIRKYGFHGTSHKYVSQKLGEVLNRDIKDMKIISCHLGNGASICAIKDGKSIDTSMGFTPLAGIAMGTRCGNIDPSISTFLIEECGYTPEEASDSLNKKSGVLGISGVSSDFRDLEKSALEGNRRAKLALDIFYYRIRGQIAAYAAHMGGVDAIIFTAGIGENSSITRKSCLEGMDFLGIKIDDKWNDVRGEIVEISTEDSQVKVFVIPTNEELMIANETLEVLNNI